MLKGGWLCRICVDTKNGLMCPAGGGGWIGVNIDNVGILKGLIWFGYESTLSLKPNVTG